MLKVSNFYDRLKMCFVLLTGGDPKKLLSARCEPPEGIAMINPGPMAKDMVRYLPPRTYQTNESFNKTKESIIRLLENSPDRIWWDMERITCNSHQDAVYTANKIEEHFGELGWAITCVPHDGFYSDRRWYVFGHISYKEQDLPEHLR